MSTTDPAHAQPILVSVIVPCYQADLIRLRHCVDAILNQEGLEGDVELILVDNGSQSTLGNHFNKTAPCKVLHEPKPGSYAARNSGIRVARGSILAFTDADCTPDRHWLKEGLDTLIGTPNLNYVAGRIVMTFRKPKTPSLFELYDALFHLRQEIYVKEAHYGTTANLIVKKSLFEAVGPFDEQYFSGGDREWGNRVWRAGFEQVLSAGAVVFHPARSTFRELGQKIRRSRGGAWLRLEKPDYTALSVKNNPAGSGVAMAARPKKQGFHRGRENLSDVPYNCPFSSPLSVRGTSLVCGLFSPALKCYLNLGSVFRFFRKIAARSR